MKTSPAGIALIERFEGLRLAAYQDQGGVWTIGYGHTAGVTQGQVITRVQAEAFLRADIADAETAVMRLVSVALKPGEFDALVSFTYNVGQGHLGESTLLKLLNAGDYENAASSFASWTLVAGKKSSGLARRRNAEAARFKS